MPAPQVFLGHAAARAREGSINIQRPKFLLRLMGPCQTRHFGITQMVRLTVRLEVDLKAVVKAIAFIILLLS
jgi:hypothetical protein